MREQLNLQDGYTYEIHLHLTRYGYIIYQVQLNLRGTVKSLRYRYIYKIQLHIFTYGTATPRRYICNYDVRLNLSNPTPTQ
jgi:hypothetical protein